MTTEPDRLEVMQALKPCPAVTYGWCQAPWTCTHPCTGRGGDSHAIDLFKFAAQNTEQRHVEELLAALKALVASFAESDEDGLTEFAEPMCRARAAIAKAEGRQ